MDNRAFTIRLSKATDMDSKNVQQILSEYIAMVAETALDFDSVAVPGFGTFTPVKTTDHIDTDPVTGRNTLVPPRIDLTFKPGSRLKKSIKSRS